MSEHSTSRRPEDVVLAPHHDFDVRLEYERLKSQLTALKEDYAALQRDYGAMREELEMLPARSSQRASFVGKYGVLWRVVHGRPADDVAYCPDCRLPLVTYPPDSNTLVICATCRLVPRGIRPLDVPMLAEKILG